VYPPGEVVVDPFGRAHDVVSVEYRAALAALLDEAVAVQFGEILRPHEPAAPVEPVHVGRHQES
jgi:hypothetical protein